MAKRSDTAKANKSHKSHSPKEGHAQGSGWGAKPDKAGKHSNKDHARKPSAGNDKAFSDIEKIAKGEKSMGKKSKDGCLPKVFMMLMLFMVVGAYFFLSS